MKAQRTLGQVVRKIMDFYRDRRHRDGSYPEVFFLRPLYGGTDLQSPFVACASYAAKKLGIKRGVSLPEARKICLALIVMPSDY
jgi:hypothetical protein